MRWCIAVVGILACATVSARVVAQAQTTTRSTANLPSVARRIAKAARYATFVTVDSAGHPQARTVQPLLPDSQWVVWFATNPRTRKVGEIERDPHVALHYFDHITASYVTLTGTARVVRDRATKEAHWDRAWSTFYSDRDTSVVLIEVRTQRLEVVSPVLGVTGDAATWRPPSVQVGRRP